MTQILPFVTVVWSQNAIVTESFSPSLQMQMKEITQKDASASQRRLQQQQEADANAEVGWYCSLSTAEGECKALLIRIKMIYSTYYCIANSHCIDSIIPLMARRGTGALSTHTVKHCGFKDVKLMARGHNIPATNSLLFIYI